MNACRERNNQCCNSIYEGSLQDDEFTWSVTDISRWFNSYQNTDRAEQRLTCCETVDHAALRVDGLPIAIHVKRTNADAITFFEPKPR